MMTQMTGRLRNEAALLFHFAEVRGSRGAFGHTDKTYGGSCHEQEGHGGKKARGARCAHSHKT